MSKIAFTNKNTGDTFSAAEANEIKASVNALYDKVDPTQTLKALTGLNPAWSSNEGHTAKITAAGNINLAFSADTIPAHCVLFFYQDGTGNRTLTVNGKGVTVNPAAATCTLVGLAWDGVTLKLLSDYSTVTTTEPPTGNTTPAAPTAPVQDDAFDTFNFTYNPSFASLSDYEQTLDGGTTVTALGAKPIVVGNVNKAAGQVGVRVKAATGRNVSAWLFNTQPFTVTAEEEPPTGGGIEYSRYYTDYTMEDANITTSTVGADRLVDAVNNKTQSTNQFTDLGFDQSGTRPKVVPNALNGYQGIEIRPGDKLQWNSGEPHFKPATVVSVCILLTQRAYGYMQHCSTMAYGVNGLNPYMVGDNNTVLESTVGIQVGVPFVLLTEFNAGATGTANGKLYVNKVKGADGPVGDAVTEITVQLYESSGLSAHYMLLEHKLLKEVLTETDKQAVIDELMAKYAIS